MMPKYIALLRGINVSGKNKIRMPDLKSLYESLGLVGVKTYIQSGNVIFEASNYNKASLSTVIENAIAKNFNIETAILIKAENEWATIIKNNPYAKNDNKDISKLHVTFLLGESSEEAINKLERVQSKEDTLKVINDVVYLYCPNGYGRTKLSNNFIERILQVPATTRNFKTVCALYAQIA